MMMNNPSSLLLIAVASLLLSGAARAQSVHFMSTPVANKCPVPNVITMTPAPAVWIAPNASRVMTKLVTNFQTPTGNYAPAANHEIHPGYFCFFDQCGPASITLVCAPVGKDTDLVETITLERVKGDKKASEPAKD
jgi:hypothetical protein